MQSFFHFLLVFRVRLLGVSVSWARLLGVAGSRLSGVATRRARRIGVAVVMALLCGACVRVVTHHPTYYRVRYINEAGGVHHVAVDRVKGGYCTRGRDQRGQRVYSSRCVRQVASPRGGAVRREVLLSHEEGIISEGHRLVRQRCPGMVYRVEEELDDLPLENLAIRSGAFMRSLAFRCGPMNDVAGSPFSEGEGDDVASSPFSDGEGDDVARGGTALEGPSVGKVGEPSAEGALTTQQLPKKEKSVDDARQPAAKK